MEVKDMIKKVYQKSGVQVDDDYIEYKMKDEEKVKAFMRLYKQEEIDSMNYISVSYTHLTLPTICSV